MRRRKTITRTAKRHQEKSIDQHLSQFSLLSVCKTQKTHRLFICAQFFNSFIQVSSHLGAESSLGHELACFIWWSLECDESSVFRAFRALHWRTANGIKSHCRQNYLLSFVSMKREEVRRSVCACCTSFLQIIKLNCVVVICREHQPWENQMSRPQEHWMFVFFVRNAAPVPSQYILHPLRTQRRQCGSIDQGVLLFL